MIKIHKKMMQIIKYHHGTKQINDANNKKQHHANNKQHDANKQKK